MKVTKVSHIAKVQTWGEAMHYLYIVYESIYIRVTPLVSAIAGFSSVQTPLVSAMALKCIRT